MASLRQTDRRRGWCLQLVIGLAAALFAHPRVARAIEYEVFVEIEGEEDLYDLLITEQIDASSFDELIDILRQGIDLSLATRDELYALPNLTYEHVDAILTYRAAVGRIDRLSDLVTNGVLSERISSSIKPFLVNRPERATPSPRKASGFVRYRATWSSGDRVVPPMALEARVKSARHLTLGGGFVLDRHRIAAPIWDPNRRALTSTGEQVRPRVAKAFARWQTERWGIIVGTYRIGFGQRLVFDTTGRYTPNGFHLDDTIIRSPWLARRCRRSRGELPESPCAGEGGAHHTPDYRVPEGMRGVAVGFERAELARGWMQGYAWFSSMNRSVYQYQIYDRGACDDPRDRNDPMCSAPPVHQTREDPLAPTERHSHQVLPSMFNEHLGGANFGYWPDRRTHVGITGYGATAQWLVGGADLDFQSFSRFPYGGPWGAIGADASWGKGWADLFIEVAHSFDSRIDAGVGGPAVIARHVATVDVHELELSGRYYGRNHVNPYSRAISAPDQLDGLRTRDETGARLRYNTFLAQRLSLRTFLDVWTQPSNGRPKLRTFARADLQTTPWLAPGLWIEYQNRDLRTQGRAGCFVRPGPPGGSPWDDRLGEESALARPEPCRGERVQLTGRLRLDPLDRVRLTLQYRHDFVDDRAHVDGFQHDLRVFAMLSANPVDALRIRIRVRYDLEDVSDRARLMEAVWAYLEITYRMRWFAPRIRYDIRVWLDHRIHTQDRSPNPEHWLHAVLESRF